MGHVMGGVILETRFEGVSWAGREANETLGASREREAKPMGFGGVAGAEPPGSMGAGVGPGVG